MYYNQGLNQTQIADQIGIDRSMVSRMLSEARKQNIVEIRINRPLSNDHYLEESLTSQFNLHRVYVLSDSSGDYQQLLQRLGSAGAAVLKEMLAPDMVLGLSWGTAVSAVVDAVETDEPIPLRIVQLVGAMGAQNRAYDGPGLVQRMGQKLGCEGYFLNAPFLVDNPEMTRALLENQNVQEAITLARQCDLAVVGVGSTEPKFSSFYKAGYVPLKDLKELRAVGMVGDVCGRHFNLEGETPELEFHKRIVTIGKKDLRAIPYRMGVAGGIGKVKPILGALRAGYLNILITDNSAAEQLLAMTS
jgi:DNA-binding transcriptional regulator LsrR (DeoR family)